MSYSIVKTDGTQLTAVVDGTIDQVTTDITLMNNFIHFLLRQMHAASKQ